MPLPQVVAVADHSPAHLAGLLPGDEIRSMNGQVPRDVIEYQLLADEAVVELEVSRGGLEVAAAVKKEAGESLGIEVSSAVFDRVRTCDNHCEFCFIYQLPKGMRRSLYLKDDDYRLSFLYGNFTTLTRFTEADLERVVEQRLSPLYVSIHATDPDVRARMLRNPRAAVSLRFLRAILDHGIDVHGQIVLCPGVNDGSVLEDTLAGILERFPELRSTAVVPLGVSRFSKEEAMRPHSRAEAERVLDTLEEWQQIFLEVLGRRLVFAADEYYLMADRPFPPSEDYEGYAQHENGIGMARAFEREWAGNPGAPQSRGGCFQWVEGAPAEGYRGPRGTPVQLHRRSKVASVGIITGEYGAAVLRPLLADRPDVEVVAVRNAFFGGNIAVTGLITGADVSALLSAEPPRRFLLPDVCLSKGRFLDGMGVGELPRPVEVVATDGHSLRRALS